MALPLLTTPTFELTQPSTGNTIEYRPFLVKEEKNLLIAREGEDEGEITRAVKNIIRDCVLSPIDTETLPSFDIEYIFLHIRGKSVGEEIELQYQHTDGKNDMGIECKHVQNVVVNVNEILCTPLEGPTKKIALGGDIIMVMKYPTMKEVENAQKKKSEVDSLFSLISACVESVFQGETPFEFDEAEMSDWLETMSNMQFEKIQKFFETMPKVRHTIKYSCGGCKMETEIDLEGLAGFFT